MSCYSSLINLLTLLITESVISATIPSSHGPTLNVSDLSNSYYLSYPFAGTTVPTQNESWTLSSDDLKYYNYLNQPARNNSVSSSIRRDDSFLNSLPSITVPPPSIPIPFHSDLGVGSPADVGKVPESIVLLEPDTSEPPVKGAIYNYLNQPARNNSVSSSIRRDDSFLNSLPSITVPPPSIPIPFHSDLGVGSPADVGKVPESIVLLEPDTTEPPVKGAIDYVLLPLLLMGVAGPLFVVMYVVVASIESKLPPNNQLKRSGGDYTRHLQTHYLDMTSLFENAQPVLSILVTSMSRAIDSDHCKEKIACRLSSYAKNFKSFRLFHYLENFVAMFVPRRYAKSYAILTAKSEGNDEACVKYNCSFIT